MIWGVDASQPLSPDEARNLSHGSVGFVCGYIGGNTPTIWTREDFVICAQAELEVLPIWVAPLKDEPGRQWGVDDGNAAVQAMIDRQMANIVALDVENGLTPKDYVKGFNDAVLAANATVCLYGTNHTLWELDGACDFTWLAWWGAPAPLHQPYPAEMWQYSSGMRFDYDIANLQFPFAYIQL